MNTSTNDANTFPQPVKKSSKNKIVIIIISAILAFIIFIVSIFLIVINVIKNSDAYKTAYDYITTNTYIKETYGEKITAKFAGGSINKSIKNGVTSGDANFKFKINGDYYEVFLQFQNSDWVVYDSSISTNSEYTEISWYLEVVKGFDLAKIPQSVNDSNAIAEYRVVYNVALQRYDYYSLKVFADRTGKFTFIVHKSEDFETGEIVLNTSKDITKVEVEQLLNAINDNDFWNLTISDKDGFDGTTTFIEGYTNGEEHFVEMWQAEEKTKIYKIHKAFADFADTFAERPTITFDD